ncbi:hypothetical protein [Phocaeicola plebeius]|jgi:hypothetical protein|uniref:hypothetical protein n=1 Tax=Phocaeicola plebeius TaxID=310297 RepID=UPI00206909E5|nr:MAG TPA: hypothetical protein [Caudoviricetes sp.]
MEIVYILRRIEDEGHSYLSNKTFNFVKQKNNMASTLKVSDVMEFKSEQDAESYLASRSNLRGLIEVVKVIKR